MSGMASFFVNDDKKLIPDNKYIIKGNKFRISILSPRLVRLEYNENGHFEDRATALVTNRSFMNFNYEVFYEETNIKVVTEYFSLVYVRDSAFNNNNLKVTVLGNGNVWHPSFNDVRNLGSINYSLDDMDEKLTLDNGLYSLTGFVALDDSNGLVIENDTFSFREPCVDIYLFVYNTELGLCLQDYFNLTGYPPMVPRYSLGCWWYKNDRYNMYDIDNMIKGFNDNNIPISVFLLGDKWHNDMSLYTFDNTLFDSNYLKNYFSSKKQRFGLSINPSNPVTANDPLYNNLVTQIPSNNNIINFIPLDNAKIQAYINNVIVPFNSIGINIFNVDYVNKNDILNLFLLNHYHYVCANMHEQGLILSRNPGLAPHRYPIIYSGKTKVSWVTLKNLARYNVSAANMGVSWQAHAIGGYYGGIENAELYLRYIQFGVFNPIFILASDAGKYYKREPWKWNQINLSVIRKYMQLRNKLVPYIYNEGYIYHMYGTPIIQPVYYKYPKLYDDPNYHNQYFFGSKIMISPIVKKKNIEMNRVVQRTFVPNGVWYDFETGKKFIGNKYYTNFYRDEDYPIFVKEGSIIPLSMDDNTDIPKNMEIQIFPALNGLYGSYELYEDDKNNHIITKMNLDKVDNGYRFTMEKKEGNLSIGTRNYMLKFRNMNKPELVKVNYNGKSVNASFSVLKNDLIVELANVDSSYNVEVFIIGNNIEIENLSLINTEIGGILDDLEISTIIKDKIDKIIFSDLPIKKKRISLRKLKKDKLEPKYINMFISLLEIAEK